MARPLSQKECEDLLEQMLAVRQEKDRIKLLKAALADTTITAQQAIAFLETVRYGDSKVEIGVVCHPHVPEGFDKVLAALPYPEDRTAVKAKLGL